MENETATRSRATREVHVTKEGLASKMCVEGAHIVDVNSEDARRAVNGWKRFLAHHCADPSWPLTFTGEEMLADDHGSCSGINSSKYQRWRCWPRTTYLSRSTEFLQQQEHLEQSWCCQVMTFISEKFIPSLSLSGFQCHSSYRLTCLWKEENNRDFDTYTHRHSD